MAQLAGGRTDLTCYEIAHEMLWEAADPRIPKQSTLLAQVSSALDQYLQQAGDEFLQLFKNISSGRTPEGSRPCDKWEYGRGGLIAKRGDEAPESLAGFEPSFKNNVGLQAVDSPDMLRRIHAASASAHAHYIPTIRNASSLSPRGKIETARNWLDNHFRLLSIPKRATGCRLSENGDPIFAYIDTKYNLDPGNFVSVRVQGRYLSVEVPQADLEQEIADMPAHQRPKTAEERRQLQEQMDIDCTNFGRRRHWRRCASAIMSFDSITACTRSSRSRGLITRRWSGR